MRAALLDYKLGDIKSLYLQNYFVSCFVTLQSKVLHLILLFKFAWNKHESLGVKCPKYTGNWTDVKIRRACVTLHR